MAPKVKAPTSTRVKGPIILTPKGKALFVSVPEASSYDPLKQEASILLTEADTLVLKAQLQEFVGSQEVKDSGIKDTGFVDALFKEDTDADGNLTGLFKVKAKTAMIYPAKLYAADGKTFVATPGFGIPNRSDIKMSVRPEVMATSMFTGVVLRLQAIKIFDMPSFDDGMSGDEDSSGSFVAPTGDAGTPQEAWGGQDEPAIDSGWGK